MQRSPAAGRPQGDAVTRVKAGAGYVEVCVRVTAIGRRALRRTGRTPLVTLRATVTGRGIADALRVVRRVRLTRPG